MDTKYILLFFICANIISLIFGYACNIEGTGCGEQFSEGVISRFFVISSAKNLGDAGGLEVNAQLQNTIGDSFAAQTGGVNTGTGGTLAVFLDGLKMVLSFIALLTPVPFLAFLFDLGVPIYIMLIIAAPSFIFWVMGFIEFIRGAQVGR